MRGSQSERRTSCTVTVELNRYGAMTLRSDRGRTYQVVDWDEQSSSGSRATPGDSDEPAIAAELAELEVDSQVSVTLRQVHGRGNTWRVTAVESGANADQSTLWL